MFFFINQILVRAAIVCFAFSLALASDEDDCSRFAYDHQMLDKIVKVEQKVEQMDKTLKASLESFLAILQYRKEEMQTLGDSLTGNLTEFKKEMQETIRVPKIAFSTTNPSSSTYSANQVLILRDTSINEGSGYNRATGEFTAPVAGLYYFSAHICSYTQSYGFIAIVVGSKDVALSGHYDHYHHVCSSVSALTNVKKGEKVFLKFTLETKLATDGYRQSSFAGVLFRT